MTKKNQLHELAHYLKWHPKAVDVHDHYGSTLLHWAIKRQNVNLTKLFIEYGADIEREDLIK